MMIPNALGYYKNAVRNRTRQRRWRLYTGGPTTTTQLLNAAFGVLSLVVKSTVIWRIAQLILQAFVKDDLNGLHVLSHRPPLA